MRSRRGMMVVLGVLMVLWACNLPQQTSVSEPAEQAGAQKAAATSAAAGPGVLPVVALTQAASTVVAGLTQTAEAAPLPPTRTPTPSPTVSPTPTIMPTPTPSTPMVSVSVNTNCRTGPGDAYDRVGALLVGETAEVLARDPYGQFWYIPNPDRPGSKCWVWGQYATVSGETASLPVFTPPPTPTPAPDFTLKGVTVKVGCAPDVFFIEISNTGGVAWRSFYLGIEDLSTSATGASAGTHFSSVKNTCSPLGDLSVINPGEGAYIAENAVGDHMHHVRFTLTLYSKPGQQGFHVTHVIEYRP